MINDKKTACRQSTRLLGAGKWLKLEEIDYHDEEGNLRHWESAERQGNPGAVLIVARLMPSNQYVLVEQYRPPADAYVLEFPAGLIDDGEDPAETARRELQEETGYTGEIRHVSSTALSTPGLTGEAAAVVLVDIDETDACNRAPEPSPDSGEFITVHKVHADEATAFLQEKEAGGTRIDIKVMSWFLARASD